MNRLLPSRLSVAEEKTRTLYFPQGMAGFEDAHQFGFIDSGEGDVACMRSLERPEAKFLVALWDEATLGTYPELTRDQRQCLMLAEGEQPLWLLVLNPFSDAEWILANLRAPVAVNADMARGMQCIRPGSHLQLHYHWMRKACEKDKDDS